jgi:hypothetical protein
VRSRRAGASPAAAPPLARRRSLLDAAAWISMCWSSGWPACHDAATRAEPANAQASPQSRGRRRRHAAPAAREDQRHRQSGLPILRRCRGAGYRRCVRGNPGPVVATTATAAKLGLQRLHLFFSSLGQRGSSCSLHPAALKLEGMGSSGARGGADLHVLAPVD